MKHGRTSLAHVIELLDQTEKVRCNLALFRNPELGTSWRVFRLFIDVAPEETHRDQIDHDYGQIAFVSDTVNGKTLAQWLIARQNGVIRGYQFDLSVINDQVNWSRSSSHLRNAGLQRVPGYYSPLPYSIYRLSFQDDQFEVLKQMVDPEETIIKAGCPGFPDYHTALAYLMHGAGRVRGEYSLASEVILRIVHTDAWIDEVRFGSKRMAVTVKGDHVAGTRLTVGGGCYHFEEELQRFSLE